MKKLRRRWRSSNWWRVLIVAALLCFTAQACFHDARQQTDNLPSTRRIANLIPVPLTYQCCDYTCGVGALQSLFYYYGKELRHDEVAKVVEADPTKGTNYRKVVEFTRSLGFQVDVRTQMSLEDLKKLIDDRKPVIVLVQAWPDSPVKWSESWDEGHYAVAVGYDESNIYFMDPSTLGHYTFVPIPEFLDRWHDKDDQEKLIHFGIVITRERATIYNPDMIKRLE